MDNVVDLVAGSPASIRFDDGSSATGAQLADEGCRLASALTAGGARPGDRLAIRLPNGRDYVRLLVACAAGGFVAVSVNTRYSDAEARDLIRRAGAGLPDAAACDGGWRTAAPIEPVGGRDDPFVVFTTSGTTSAPKMVLHRQASIADHAADVADGFGYGLDDVVLVAMPLCGTFGLASLTGALGGAGEVVVTDFEVARASRLLAARRVTGLNGSDDMFHRLIDAGADLSSLRLGGYARFNTSLDGIVTRAQVAGAVLTGLYGMSEVQALFAVRDPSLDAAERERAGGRLVSPRAAVRVVDGELRLRGPSLFAGYLADGGDRVDDALTAAAHDADGWFRTGDHAEVESARTFHFVSRIGDVMRLGGFLVAPAEVEAALVSIDGVEAAQVVAIDRPEGARPVAFVIAPDGLDETAAIVHCRDRLARYKVPVRVIVLDEFPSTPSANGTKIQKAKLRQLAAALD